MGLARRKTTGRAVERLVEGKRRALKGSDGVVGLVETKLGRLQGYRASASRWARDGVSSRCPAHLYASRA